MITIETINTLIAAADTDGQPTDMSASLNKNTIRVIFHPFGNYFTVDRNGSQEYVYDN